MNGGLFDEDKFDAKQFLQELKKMGCHKVKEYLQEGQFDSDARMKEIARGFVEECEKELQRIQTVATIAGVIIAFLTLMMQLTRCS